MGKRALLYRGALVGRAMELASSPLSRTLSSHRHEAAPVATAAVPKPLVLLPREAVRAAKLVRNEARLLAGHRLPSAALRWPASHVPVLRHARGNRHANTMAKQRDDKEEEEKLTNWRE